MGIVAVILGLSTLVAAELPNSCDKATALYAPDNAGYRCNATVAPKPVYAQSALLTAYTPITFDDCINKCYNATACKTLTYRAESQTCDLYKYDVGPNLKVQQMEGTRFYSRKCLSQLLCFKLQIRGSTSHFNGSFITPVQDGASNQAFTVAESTNRTTDRFYYDRDFGLISDDVGNRAVNYHNNAHPRALPYTIFFPSSSFLNSYQPANRQSITCSNDNQVGKLSCQSGAGNTFYACDGDSSEKYAGIALAPSNVPQPFKNSGSTACYPVSIYLVPAYA